MLYASKVCVPDHLPSDKLCDRDIVIKWWRCTKDIGEQIDQAKLLYAPFVEHGRMGPMQLWCDVNLWKVFYPISKHGLPQRKQEGEWIWSHLLIDGSVPFSSQDFFYTSSGSWLKQLANHPTVENRTRSQENNDFCIIMLEIKKCGSTENNNNVGLVKSDSTLDVNVLFLDSIHSVGLVKPDSTLDENVFFIQYKVRIGVCRECI